MKSKFRAWLSRSSLTRAQRCVVTNAVEHCKELHGPGTCQRKACEQAAVLLGAEVGDVFENILGLRGRRRRRG